MFPPVTQRMAHIAIIRGGMYSTAWAGSHAAATPWPGLDMARRGLDMGRLPCRGCLLAPAAAVDAPPVPPPAATPAAAGGRIPATLRRPSGDPPAKSRFLHFEGPLRAGWSLRVSPWPVLCRRRWVSLGKYDATAGSGGATPLPNELGPIVAS